MFKNLTTKLKDIFNNIAKKAIITEKDLDITLREIRLVLIEADVNIAIIKEIIPKIKADLIDKEIYRSVSPKQVILKSVYDHMLALLTDQQEEIKLPSTPTTFYLMAGLQGVGKTTTSAKIAYHFKNKLNKKVLLVSLDFSRPAAYEQLQVLCNNNQLDFFIHDSKNLDTVINNFMEFATKNSYDVAIIDTAGRLSIDNSLMDELRHIHKMTKAKEILFVMDSMLGQISLEVIKRFQEIIPLSGVVVSKADGDARGGAVLSCKHITNLPIKFMGVGEKINNLEAFIPKRIVDRILDQGDIISLIENLEENISEEDKKIEEKLLKGKLSLEDFKKQLLSMKKMGGFSSMLSMIPGMSGLGDKIKSGVNDSLIKKNIAIIDSMTKQEKYNPSVLNFSRKKRIAAGSGSTLQDINILLKQYESTVKMLKQLKSAGGNPSKMFKQLGIDPLKIRK